LTNLNSMDILNLCCILTCKAIGTPTGSITMDTEQKITQKKESTEKPILGGGKVLVMEEDESIRKMLPIMLERIGYESEIAQDGDEAIELYKQAMALGQPHNVVILDLTDDSRSFVLSALERVRQDKDVCPDISA